MLGYSLLLIWTSTSAFILGAYFFAFGEASHRDELRDVTWRSHVELVVLVAGGPVTVLVIMLVFVME